MSASILFYIRLQLGKFVPETFAAVVLMVTVGWELFQFYFLSYQTLFLCLLSIIK